jgi:hypothetical protein
VIVQAGVVVLWKVDPSGRHSLSNTIRKTGVPTACTYLSYPGAAVVALAAGSAESTAAAPVDGEGTMLACTVPVAVPGATGVLFSGDSGVVTYANDTGFTIDVLTNLHSTVDVLEFQPETSRIVVITRSMLMTHLHYSPADGKMNSITRSKISIRGTAGIRQHSWVGGGLLATTTPEESMVRYVTALATSYCFRHDHASNCSSYAVVGTSPPMTISRLAAH